MTASAAAAICRAMPSPIPVWFGLQQFKGHRDGESKLTNGTWETYKGTGKLDNIKGKGEFNVTSGDVPGEFILEMEGNYELIIRADFGIVIKVNKKPD